MQLCAAEIRKGKFWVCSLSSQKQRVAQFNPIREIYQSEKLIHTMNEEQNTKKNSKNNRICNKTDEIFGKICFVYTVTFAWKEVPSLELTQTTDNSIKEGL